MTEQELFDFSIPRNGNVDLEFEGYELAEVIGAKRDGRWSEVHVYATSTNKWVVEIIGTSDDNSRPDKTKVSVCLTPDKVREALTIFPGKGLVPYIPGISLDVLHKSVKADTRLEPALIERA